MEGKFATRAGTASEGITAPLFLGHLGLMLDIKHGLDYMQRLSDEYGDIVKVKGLGVCWKLLQDAWVG